MGFALRTPKSKQFQNSDYITNKLFEPWFQ